MSTLTDLLTTGLPAVLAGVAFDLAAAVVDFSATATADASSFFATAVSSVPSTLGTN